MPKPINIMGIVVFFIFVLFSLSFAVDETMTITTYYPSPYGSYNKLYVASNVGIGTTAPGFELSVAQNMTMGGDVTNGTAQMVIQGATTVGKKLLLGYDTNGNGFGFIKAGNEGVTWTNLALQPNGGNVGIGTTGPGEKLEVNGNIKFTVDGSIMSKAPRAIHTTDPRAGCPSAWAANTDFFTSSFTLSRSGTVLMSGDLIRLQSGRADLQLYVDGGFLMQAITNTGTSADWVGGHVQWTGVLAAGAHTVSMRSPQANVWGCGSSWGSMDVLIFE